MFFAVTLTEDQAYLIAEAYYRSGKNPKAMAACLGVQKFDLELIRHPLVKRQINKLAERMRQLYTLEQHLDRLQEIRDSAMADGNLRIALAAELSVGKAAGLYEKIAEAEVINDDSPSQLTTEQIKERLAKLEQKSQTPLLVDSQRLAVEELPDADEI